MTICGCVTAVIAFAGFVAGCEASYIAGMRTTRQQAKESAREAILSDLEAECERYAGASGKVRASLPPKTHLVQRWEGMRYACEVLRK